MLIRILLTLGLLEYIIKSLSFVGYCKIVLSILSSCFNITL